jgi:hypothetical protein
MIPVIMRLASPKAVDHDLNFMIGGGVGKREEWGLRVEGPDRGWGGFHREHGGVGLPG